MIVLASNFLNHHMLPLCQELDRLTGHSFRFVATELTPAEQRELGYKPCYEEYPFVVPAYRDRETQAYARKLCRDSEVLIYGSTPLRYYIGRLLERKLSFRYSERVLREPYSLKNLPLRLGKYLLRDAFTQYPQHYLLAASAYTASDFSSFRAFRGRAFRWGYFPPFHSLDPAAVLQGKKPGSILWAGRMIPLKRPLLAVEVAERLRERNVPFQMNMVGAGELFAAIQQAVADRGLQNCVHVSRAVPNEELRTMMEEAELYLFTSNREEGWGAVLNEAMNSACAVIAYRGIGAAPFLLRDGENGVIFDDQDADWIAGRCEELLRDRERRQALGMRAYETIRDEWNAEVAARRLLDFIETRKPYASGPMSPAPVSAAGRDPEDAQC